MPPPAPDTRTSRSPRRNRLLAAALALAAATTAAAGPADDAAELLFVAVPADSTELASLFGNPSDDQRRRAADAAQQIYELAGEARLAVEEAIAAIESTPGFSGDDQLRGRRRDLIERERRRRIPFLRGAGAYLHATLNVDDPAEQARLYREAAGLLLALDGLLPADLEPRARRYAGLALAGLGELDRAEIVLAAVEADPDAAGDDRFAAQLGRVEIETARGGPARGLAALTTLETKYAQPGDLPFRVLLADARFALLREAGRPGDAYAAYLDLLEADLGVARADLRALVLDRLARAADSGAPIDGLPDLVAIARARRLAADEATLDQGIALDEALLERPLHDEARADVLFDLGRALLDAGDLDAAAGRFTTIAREHPADHRAERSIEAAAQIAEALNARRGDARSRARLRETLDLMLGRYPNLASIDRWRYAAGCLAIDEGRFEDAAAHLERVAPDAPQRPDAWSREVEAIEALARAEIDPAARFERYGQVVEAAGAAADAIERALARASGPRAAELRRHLDAVTLRRARALLARGDPAAALEALEGVAVSGETAVARLEAYEALGRPDDARLEIERLLNAGGDEAGPILVGVIEARREPVEALLDSGRADEALALAQDRLVGPARALAAWLSGRPDPQLARLRVAAGDALRDAGRLDEAILLYDAVLETHPDALAALAGRAECLFGLGGDDAEAMAIYRRLAVTNPDGEHYWLAQLRMLQILDRTGRNAEQIVPHVRQLRENDPELGGARFRGEFEELLRRH